MYHSSQFFLFSFYITQFFFGLQCMLQGCKIAQNNSKCWLYYLWKNHTGWGNNAFSTYLPTMCKPTCRHPEIEKRKPCAAMMCNCQKKSVINWTWLLITRSDWPIVMMGRGGLPCLHLVLQGHFLSEHQGRGGRWLLP